MPPQDDQQSSARDDAAATRDRAAADRDRLAALRDAAQAQDDQRTSDRDDAASDRVISHDTADRRTWDRRVAVSDRRHAVSDRDHTASDRHELQVTADQRARDRDTTADDRLHAADDRSQAAADRRVASGERQAANFRDSLTGLGNLRRFHEHLDRLVLEGGAFALVLLDLDSFEALNADYGRQEGDHVLQHAARSLESAMAPEGIVSRVGGDEFAALLPGAGRAQAERVVSEVALALGELRHGVGLSAGIACHAAGAVADQATLVRDAELELYVSQPGAASRRRYRRTAERAATSLIGSTDHVFGEQRYAKLTRACLDRCVAVGRQMLGLPVVFMATFEGHTGRYSAVSGEGTTFGVSEGGSFPVETSYVRRLLLGEVPNAVPDAGEAPVLLDPTVTADLTVGAFVGVPVRFSDGFVCGVVCGVSHERRPTLGQAEVAALGSIAEMMAEYLEQGEFERHVLRLHSESAAAGALLAALDARDHYTGRHSQTVVRLARRTARRLACEEERVAEIEQAALLHDIGKIGVPDAILSKPGPLDEHEWQLMRQHPPIGAQIVASIPSLAHLAPVVAADHEYWDGTGYPHGLAADTIPLASRIVLACDAYDAMTTDRPYRPALSPTDARAELERHAGTQFDPGIVRALLAVLSRPAAVAEAA